MPASMARRHSPFLTEGRRCRRGGSRRRLADGAVARVDLERRDCGGTALVTEEGDHLRAVARLAGLLRQVSRDPLEVRELPEEVRTYRRGRRAEAVTLLTAGVNEPRQPFARWEPAAVRVADVQRVVSCAACAHACDQCGVVGVRAVQADGVGAVPNGVLHRRRAVEQDLLAGRVVRRDLREDRGRDERPHLEVAVVEGLRREGLEGVEDTVGAGDVHRRPAADVQSCKLS